MSAVSSSKAKRSAKAYCCEFPLQFIDVYHADAGGIYVMTHDTTNQPRTYFLDKKEKVSLGVEYEPRTLEPGAHLDSCRGGRRRSGRLARCLGSLPGLGQSWYRPEVVRKRWFQEVFNFRQVFLNPNLGASTGAFDPATKKYTLNVLLEEDGHAFGGVDFVHIFDWGHLPGRVRLGDYDTWDYLGGPSGSGPRLPRYGHRACPSVCILKATFEQPGNVAKTQGQAWQLLDARGVPYARMGLEYQYACPHGKEWRDYLTGKCVEAVKKSGAGRGLPR